MHDYNVLFSKSLDWKDSYVCNFDTILEPLITREACGNGSGVEKVDGSDLKLTYFVLTFLVH